MTVSCSPLSVVTQSTTWRPLCIPCGRNRAGARSARRVACQAQRTRPPAAAAVAVSGTQPRAGPASHAPKAHWGDARSALTQAPSESSLDAWRGCRPGERASPASAFGVVTEREGWVAGRAPPRARAAGEKRPPWRGRHTLHPAGGWRVRAVARCPAAPAPQPSRGDPPPRRPRWCAPRTTQA